jgi:hypothetical protein
MEPSKRQNGLTCEQCGKTSRDGRGWKALLYVEDDDEGVEVPASPYVVAEGVLVYCPSCAARKFGGN